MSASRMSRWAAAAWLLCSLFAAPAWARPALLITNVEYQIDQIVPVPDTAGTYEVTARPGIRNLGELAYGATAQITSVGSGVTILDGDVTFGVVNGFSYVPAHSTDTFTIRFVKPATAATTPVFDYTRSVLRSVRWRTACSNCGGNRAPIAHAGAPQTVFVGQTITLDGSASIDPNGDALRFQWSIISSPVSVALSDPTAVRPTLVLQAPGTYTFELVVRDQEFASAPSRVTITTANSMPTADAGPDQRVDLGSHITLSGVASSDVDGDALTYEWTLIEIPSGSAATLLNADPASPMADFVVDRTGRYVAGLTVRDASSTSFMDTVVIATHNAAPVADAGPDLTARIGEPIEISGARSMDPDGDELEFVWWLVPPEGSAAELSTTSGMTTSFVPDVPGSYIVQMYVGDGDLESWYDTMVVSTTNSRPTAVAGPDLFLSVGSAAALDGSGSSDADGDALSFTWSLLSAPAGSAASIADRQYPLALLTPDVPGIYVAQLIVNDGVFDSEPSTKTIHVAAPDTTGPEIHIDSPPAGSITRYGAVRLVGQLSEAGTLRIGNAVVAIDAQHRFSHEVALEEGRNRIAIEATDVAGNVRAIEWPIELDTVPPTVPILFRMEVQPQDGDLFRVQGASQSVESLATVQVTNTRTGATATTVAEEDGAFDLMIAGGEGDTFLVVALDPAGNRSPPTKLRAARADELRLDILAPANGAQLDDRSVLIRGSVVGPLDTGVSINHVPVALAGATETRSFQFRQSLLAGENIIEIVAERPDGARVRRELRLTRTSAPAFGVSAVRTTGVAPFDVLFEVAQYEEGEISEVTIDQDSDGQIDVTSPSDDRFIAARYASAGSFVATISATTGAGETMTFRVPITVQTPAEVGEQVSQTWNVLIDAMRSSDLPTVLSLLTPSAAGRYGPAFEQLGSDLPSITEGFDTLSISHTSSEYAEGVIARNVEGVDRAFIITFLKTRDGRWRVASF